MDSSCYPRIFVRIFIFLRRKLYYLPGTIDAQ